MIIGNIVILLQYEITSCDNMIAASTVGGVEAPCNYK